MGPYDSPPSSPGIYSERDFYYLPDHVHVRLENGNQIVLRVPYVQNILPRLDRIVDGYREIDLDSFALQIAHKMHKSVRGDRYWIYSCLTEFFYIVEESYGQPPLFGSMITGFLEQCLFTGHSRRGFTSSLTQARRSFIILSQVAKRTESMPLASTLANFFLLYRDNIIGREHTKYLSAWGLAFMDMRSQLSQAEGRRCFRALADRLEDIRESARYFRYHDLRWNEMIRIMVETLAWDLDYFDDWDLRGRRLRRPLLYTAPRARTMPPPLIHHRASPYITPAPSPSMELVPAVDPQCVVENLVDLQGRVADLERDRELSVPLSTWSHVSGKPYLAWPPAGL